MIKEIFRFGQALLLGAAFFTANLLLSSDVFGQEGDRKGHVMDPPPEHWDIPPAPVVEPEDAMSTFELEDGFRLELVAAEPMVHDPVAIAFDGNGRIWVAEMRGYMPDIEGELEDETYGRISVLEDTDGDGRADKHTVFLEKFLLPRAIALVDADRSLLFADNQSLYEADILIDEKGEISAGEVEVIDANYAEGGNPEHKPNGLRRALDNWFYNAKSDTRYRKVNGSWLKTGTEDRGQWGIKQDNYGRLLTNTNSNFITVEELPPGVTVRNPAHEFRSKVSSKVEDQKVWPIRITPGINRGYMGAFLDDEGYLLRPTAVSGMSFYRGDHFPEEYHGNIFVPEPAGNLVKRIAVEEGDDGFRTLQSGTRGSEFLASTDERSRMVDAYTAPDGSLYLLDFYRGIIQHRAYLTTFLRRQIEERGLDTPVGLGRIYRVVHEDGKPLNEAPRMQDREPAELVAHLAHPNGWWRDTAQRFLVELGDDAVVPALEDMARNHDNHLARIHAIWTLEGLGAFTPTLLESALEHSHPRVTAEAIRASESLALTESAGETLIRLTTAVDHPSIIVARQLAASLGIFGENAVPALVELVSKWENDTIAHDLAVSGIYGRESELFAGLESGHPLREPLIETVIRGDQQLQISKVEANLEGAAEWKTFARAAVHWRRASVAKNLFASLAEPRTDDRRASAVVEGMLAGGDAASGKKKGKNNYRPMPVIELATLDASTLPDGVKPARIDEIRKLFREGSDQEETFLTTEEHRRQFKEGEAHYQRICMACHQVHGKGQIYLAPPLVGTDWVQGSKERLIALVMDGVSGPIEVLGKTYTAPEIQPLMPGLRLNPEVDDEQLAAILTYVRNAWGNSAPPVSAEELTRYRESTEPRQPWTAEELMEIE